MTMVNEFDKKSRKSNNLINQGSDNFAQAMKSIAKLIQMNPEILT